MSKPTAERVRELLRYDPESGVFTWKKCQQRPDIVGTVAGTFANNGYVRINVDGKKQLAHRLAWLYMTGEWPAAQIDHINGVRSDNRWCNFRPATHTENNWNVGKQTSNTSGFKGVSWHKDTGKWRAEIRHNGKQFHLGLFDDPELAALCYAGASRLIHGDFSHSTNIITINNFYGANENGK